MADNFDLKKFLKESKALENLNPSMKSINEGEAAYEYEKGKKEGEEIEKKKMTKEAMKKQIKDMIVAELELDIDNPGKTDDAEASAYDPVYEDEGLYEAKMYFHVLEDAGYGEIGHKGAYDTEEEAQNRADSLSDMFPNSTFYIEVSDSEDEPYSVTMEEAKKKDKVEDVEDVEVTDTEIEDVPAEDEMPAEEAPAADGGIEDLAADMKGTEADLMDHLMKAFQIAKGMQNEKLETQVGNTLKFFVSEYIGGGEQ